MRDRVSAAPIRRRWPLAAAISAAMAVLLLVVWFLVPWWIGRPWGGKISDREQRASLVIPRGWVDATSEEAGQVVSEDSGDEVDPYRMPDLAATSWDSDQAVQGPQHVGIVVLPSAGSSLDRCTPNTRLRSVLRSPSVITDGGRLIAHLSVNTQRYRSSSSPPQPPRWCGQ